MPSIRDALADINAVRAQIARATQFRGYGPASVAATGVLAFLVATLQAHWLKGSGRDWGTFLAIWIATAVVCLILTGVETVMRARRVHSDLASEMIYHAAEQFVPALVAGFLLTLVFMRFAPGNLWMLPGLWQIVFSLGVFASRRFLPWQVFLVGAWYLATGLVCIAVSSAHGTASPWAMGVPFGLGQLLVAAVLQFGYREPV
jgi:hypothetical protein